MRQLSPLRAALLMGALVFSLLSAPAWAQRDLGLPAPPFSSDTLRDDGSALLTNPANTTFRPGIDAGLGLTMMSRVQTGDAVYSYFNYTAPFRLSVGGGLAARFGDDRGLTGFASLGWGAGPLSVALRYRVYQAMYDPMHGVSTSDLGVAFRPTSFMALSFVVTNLWTPRISPTELLPREYRLESGWRLPCGALGVAAQWILRDEQHFIGAHLDARIVPGFRLFASVNHRIVTPNDHPSTADSPTTFQAGLQVQSGKLSSDVAVRYAGRQGDARVFGASGLFRFSTSPNAPVSYPAGSLLKVELSGRLTERPSSQFLGADSKGFVDQLMALREARDSRQVEGVYLHLSGIRAGVAQLWELRRALDDIRNSGKKVVVYIEQGGIRDLYLAAAGDYVMASPAFFSMDSGLRVERYYLAELLQRIEIEATFVRVGRYKSAVEMFTRDEPSSFADEALERYVSDVWEVIARGLCENRSNAACPRGSFPFDAPISAGSLRASGWLNDLGYEDELPAKLGEHFGRRYRPIEVSQLHNDDVERWGSPREIAVLHITGDIVAGKSGTNPLTGAPFTGTNAIEAAVRQIQGAGAVRGVIVRVDSPGGSAFASDEILRAVAGLQRADVPVVVSFGDTAASGGYYVAAFPTTIFASPTTLTGSIGIYAGTFALDDLLHRIGVNRESTTEGGPTRMYGARRWSEEEIAWMQASVDHGYARFVSLVGEARGLDSAELEMAADGRIWSGRAAKAQGLVDEMGGFLDAYDALCAQLPRCTQAPYRLRHYGQVMSLNLPSAVAAIMRIDAEKVDTSDLRSLLEHSGLGGTMGILLGIIPTRAAEARADLGGVFHVIFE